MRQFYSFLAAISFLLAAGACGEKGPTEPTTGTVLVTASVSGVDVDADGFNIMVDGGSSQRVSSGSSATFPNLSAGQHVVQIDDVADNCTVDGGLVKSVTVTAGQTATVGFSINCEAIDIISGTWNYTNDIFAVDGSVACSMTGPLDLTANGDTFSGSGTIRMVCPVTGFDDVALFEVVNGVVNGAQVAFGIANTSFPHMGTIVGNSMSGSATWDLGDGVAAAVDWSATRAANLQTRGAPRNLNQPSLEALRKAILRLYD